MFLLPAGHRKRRCKSRLLSIYQRNKPCERCFLCRSLEFCKNCHKCPNCCHKSSCRGKASAVLGEVGNSGFESKSYQNGTQYRVAGNGRLVKKDFPSAQQLVSHHDPTSASLQQSQSKTDTQDITSPMSQAMTYSSVLQTPPTNGQPSSYRQSSITDWASQSADAQGVSSSSQWQQGAKTKTSSQDSRRTYTSPTSVTYK